MSFSSRKSQAVLPGLMSVVPASLNDYSSSLRLTIPNGAEPPESVNPAFSNFPTNQVKSSSDKAPVLLKGTPNELLEAQSKSSKGPNALQGAVEELEDGEVHEMDVDSVNESTSRDLDKSPRQDIRSIEKPRSHQPTPSTSRHALQNNTDPLHLAHNLVTEMHSWGVTFDDFVNEGMSPTLLRQLYAECGLSNAQTISEPMRKPQKATSPGLNSQTTESTSISKVSPTLKPEAVAPLSLPSRKDLIAQKLAARDIHLAASPSVKVNSLDTLESSLTEPLPVLDPRPISSPQPSAIPDHGASIIGQPLKDADTKRRIRTELARQKMEALRQKGSESHRVALDSTKLLATSDAQPHDSSNANLKPVTDPAPVPVLETLKINEEISAQTASISPSSALSPFSIPGLSSVLGRRHSSTKDVASDTSQERIELLQASTTSDKNERPAKTNRLRATDFLHSPGKSRKKPLVTADTGLIIDLSEDEDDDSAQCSTGRASQVDESEATSAIDTNVAGHASLRNQSFAQSTNSYSPRLPEAELTDSRARLLGATLSPVPGQTPTDKKVNGLRTRELQIEVMNQKIAELQQKIKKRSGSKPSIKSPDGMVEKMSNAPIVLSTKSDVDQSALLTDLPSRAGHLEEAENLSSAKDEIDKEVASLDVDFLSRAASTAPDEVTAITACAVQRPESVADPSQNLLQKPNAIEIENTINLMDQELTETREKLKELLSREQILISAMDRAREDGRQMGFNAQQRYTAESITASSPQLGTSAEDIQHEVSAFLDAVVPQDANADANENKSSTTSENDMPHGTAGVSLEISDVADQEPTSNQNELVEQGSQDPVAETFEANNNSTEGSHDSPSSSEDGEIRSISSELAADEGALASLEHQMTQHESRESYSPDISINHEMIEDAHEEAYEPSIEVPDLVNDEYEPSFETPMVEPDHQDISNAQRVEPKDGSVQPENTMRSSVGPPDTPASQPGDVPIKDSEADPDDDYEPDDPMEIDIAAGLGDSSRKQDGSATPIMLENGEESASQPSAEKVDTDSQEVLLPEAAPQLTKYGHFQPYESVLRRFRTAV